jgi:pimeloyl-ACP methyl ester carboxylesterase
MVERHVEVPGGRLHVVEEGSGPPIVLLHAGIVDATSWDPLVPHLVAAGYRAIAFDRRGSGGSVTEDVAFSNRDDVRAVMDSLGVARACLVGNSVGGQIALDVAVETPERVVALVAVGSSVGGLELPATPEEESAFAEMERLEASGDADAIADFDVRLWVDGPGQPPTRVPAEIREAVRAMTRRDADPTRPRGRPIPLAPPAAQRLDALTMPVLAVAGALDVSDVPATARFLEDAAPRARAVVVPDAAHLIGLEAPGLLARLIIEHVAPLEPWS